MITKKLPGFSFTEPTNRNVINIRVESRIVVGETRSIRGVWTPEMAQDIMAFHNIDAEAELTALLTEDVRHQIDNQILNDLRTRGWNNLFNSGLLFNNTPTNEMDGILLPISRRVAAQTIGLDLVGVQTIQLPNLNYINNIQSNYNLLPNEEGWYTNDTWESILINMYLKPYKFIERAKRRRRDRRNYPGSL